MGDEKLLATFGFGYSEYEQQTNEIQGNLQIYIPQEDNLKVNILKLLLLDSNSSTPNT